MFSFARRCVLFFVFGFGVFLLLVSLSYTAAGQIFGLMVNAVEMATAAAASEPATGMMARVAGQSDE